jgi:two-component system, NtrC family, nitrogen regulation response regulator NtrX
MTEQHMETDSSDSRNGRVLVVDDEKNIRSSLEMILTTEGYAVHLAKDGVQAEEILATVPVDVILLDIRLPGASGIELLKKWKGTLTTTAIILMSGEASLTEALDGLKLGAFDFLEKPVLHARLLTTIRHAVDRVTEPKRIDLGHGETVIGQNPELKKLVLEAQTLAKTKARVLITGESGTGKDLLARLIHLGSPRKEKSFIKINCASIAPDLIESELFGHVKGAFTGAVQARRGHFEAAHGGTIFLDEVGELSLSAQAKMLRTLQNGEITPVGSSEVRVVDVRVVAATNRDLKKEVQEGRFREDLFYRLSVVTIESIPLRKRLDDLPLLCQFFLKQIGQEYGVHGKSIAPEAMDAMGQYPWSGNIRELRNVMERCMILASDVITLSDLPLEIACCGQAEKIDSELKSSGISNARNAVGSKSEGTAGDYIEPWHQFKARSEREHIMRALRASHGQMAEAAKLLQVERQTMYKWAKIYGIDRER